MTIDVSSICMCTEQRKRLSLASVDEQLSHEHPITGTPWDVPVPKNVTFRFNQSAF